MTTDLTWFDPTKTQLDFIHCDEKETIYAGGVGAGKTLSGGFKTLRACLEYPGTTGLVGRQTYRALEDTTKRVILDGDDKPPIIAKELIAHRDDRENRVVLKNGSEILFRSLEDWNTEKLRSLNLGFAYVDEATETTFKVWSELCGRLRHPLGPRQIWGTTNPNGHDWLWKRFHIDGGINAGPLFHQPTRSNPHLAPDYLAHLLTMPKEWVKRMVDGSFDTASGMIWDEWNRDIHVIESHIVSTLPPTWWRFRSMDHGRRNPTCVLWWLVDSDGFIIVGDEHYEEGMLPSQHAPIVSAKDAMDAPGIGFGPIIAPPDCFRMDLNGHSVADEYFDASGLLMTVADDNVEAGLLRVSEWLHRDPELHFPRWHKYSGTKGPDGLGAPRVFVSEKAPNLITEIPDYRWRDLGPSQESKQDQPEEPRKMNDHACDAFRYGLMSRPRPRGRVSQRDPDRDRPRMFSAGIRERTF